MRPTIMRPGGFVPLGSMAATFRRLIHVGLSRLCHGLAASRRWATWRLSASGVSRLSGSCAPLDSTYTAASSRLIVLMFAADDLRSS